MVRASLPFRNAKQWSSTLNLPRSNFPPRPLESARPAYIKRCCDDLYASQSERSADRSFVLHDGPPYANGPLHIGHALNKVLKDVICRFHISQGRKVQYIPGWDCHGLPIEIKALQSHESFKQLSALEIRAKAKALATATIKQQEKGFREWAVLGDWDHHYRTMEPDYELRQLEVFRKMVKQGIIHRQFKPVHWSPSSGTALAEAELEYDENHESRAAYIKFKTSRLPPLLSKYIPADTDLYALIWTTTPWTIPANRAISINKSIQYCVFHVKSQNRCYIVAQDLLPEILERGGVQFEDAEVVVGDLSGQSLLQEGSLTYINPFRPQHEQPFVLADYVSNHSGTGLVHTAPGHGLDDFEVCRNHGIEAFSPVDDEGKFTAEAYPQNPTLLAGKEVLTEGTRTVLDILVHPFLLEGYPEDSDCLLWSTHEYVHKYPIDWRTKLPTIIRATAQWFADVGSIKNYSLAALDGVKFLPEGGRSRLESFISGRSQWCISRQRVWGVPIPALYASDGTAVMTSSTVEHIIKVIKTRGIDSWWTDDEHDPAWVAPELEPDSYTRGRDTMDVWFDSGTSWSLLDHRHGKSPADVYLEGTDQHRGWFQASLLTSIANQAADSIQVPCTAPFATLITHGFTLDHEGRKMSKSLGNVISPDEIMSGAMLPPLKKRKGQKGQPDQLDTMGPDALRLWVASSDYTRDVVVGPIVLQNVNTSLHKYRITFKWLLGALVDHNETASATDVGSTYYRLADRIALLQLSDTVAKVHDAYSNYDFVRAMNTISNYVSLNLSAFYFETAKDHLYTGGRRERQRVQRVCYRVLTSLMSMLGPVLPLLVTEVVDHASPTLRSSLEGGHEIPNAIFKPWGPTKHPRALDREGAVSRSMTTRLFEIHAAVKSAQEAARTDKRLGQGLDCHVLLQPATDLHAPTLAFLRAAACAGDLADVLVVSSVSVGPELDSAAAPNRANAASATEWVYSREVELSIDESEAEAAKDAGRSVTVHVLPPRGAKCPRCWRSVVVQGHPPEPQPAPADDNAALCGRCRNALAEQSAAAVAAATP